MAKSGMGASEAAQTALDGVGKSSVLNVFSSLLFSSRRTRLRTIEETSTKGVRPHASIDLTLRNQACLVHDTSTTNFGGGGGLRPQGVLDPPPPAQRVGVR